MFYTFRGQTALHKAATYKLRNICCMLVAGGATVSVQDNKGMTPRLLALQAEDHELAAYLESKYTNENYILSCSFRGHQLLSTRSEVCKL